MERPILIEEKLDFFGEVIFGRERKLVLAKVALFLGLKASGFSH
ncbi:hypothetical protein AMTRI_Chr13g84520 [Amborella trichopoda]